MDNCDEAVNSASEGIMVAGKQMVSREEILWAYRSILGREPEEDAVYDWHAQCTNFDELRETLICSEEASDNLRKKLSSNSGPFVDYFRVMTIFLHIPKTGGTTLNHWLCEAFGIETFDSEYTNIIHRRTLSELNQLDYISGHMNFDEAMAMPRASKVLIASFRQPFVRLISLYRFYRSHPVTASASELVSLAHALPIEEFFLHATVRASAEVDNRYLRTFSYAYALDSDYAVDKQKALPLAINRIGQLGAIVIAEQMELAIRLLAQRYRIINPPIMKYLQVTDNFPETDSSFERVSPVIVDENLTDIIAPLVEFDLEIYECAKAIFEQSVAAGMSGHDLRQPTQYAAAR